MFATLTEFVATFTPLLHAKLTPAVVELAVSVTEVIAQVKVASGPAFAFGGVRLEVTITLSVAVHVFASVNKSV